MGGDAHEDPVAFASGCAEGLARSSHTRGDKQTVRIRAATHDTEMQICAMTTGPPEPLLSLVAKDGFGTLPLAFLRELCSHVGLPPGTSLVPCIVELAKHVLPGISDDDLMEILQRRSLKMEAIPEVRDLVDDDVVCEVFSPADQKQLKSEMQVTINQQQDLNDLKMEVKQYREKLLGKKKLKAAAKAASKELSKRKFPCLEAVLKSASNDLPQSEAKVLMPPGGYIWRANFGGSWQCHVPPHARHTESWAQHGNDSRKSMLACIRFAWSQFLEDEHLETSDCPIAGLFT